MSNAKSNVIVAVTVLAALVAMGWMIVKFGGTLGGIAAGGGYEVGLSLPRVDGLSEGARVTYRGRGVGRVAVIELAEDRVRFDVTLVMLDETVPDNVVGVVRATNPISGGAAIELELQGETATGSLAEGDGTIPGESERGGLIPAELPELANEVRLLVAEMREQNLAGRIGELVGSVNEIAGDGQLREDLKATVANTRRATDEAAVAAEEYRKLGQRFNELGDRAETVLADANEISGDAKATAAEARQLIQEVRGEANGRLRQVDELLARANTIAAKVDDGEGTAGMLLNDPEAYQALRDDLRILGRVLEAAERVVEQIEQEGVKVSVF